MPKRAYERRCSKLRGNCDCGFVVGVKARWIGMRDLLESDKPAEKNRP
jgi:hypothetical protein